MAKPNNYRDLEALIAETRKNRVQIQKAWEKVQTLEAAIESAKESRRKTKSGSTVGEKWSCDGNGK